MIGSREKAAPELALCSSGKSRFKLLENGICDLASHEDRSYRPNYCA